MKLVELQYLPSPAYLALFDDDVIIEQHENFEKQSYRNRCRILTPNGIDQLTVPVKGGNSKQLIRDIRIDYTQKWVNRHSRAIQSAYGKAPFFEYYFEDFSRVFQKQHKFLFDLNLDMLTVCRENLQIGGEFVLSTTFKRKEEDDSNDLRSVIHPKRSYSETYRYQPKSYYQLFGKAFVQDLSVLDVLFCEGPNAWQIILSGLEV